MKTKSIFKTLVLLISIANFSCSKPEETNNTSNVPQNKIEGVWMTYGTDNPYQSGFSSSWIIFFAKGKSLTIMPLEGLYNYNIANETNLDVGTYTWSGTSGQNKKNNVSQYLDELVLVKENELKVGSKTYYRCQDLTGKKLNAGYTSFANASDPDLNTLPVGENPKILFDSNGNFEDWGIYNTALFDAYSNPSTVAPGYGTYEIKDFSLILAYQDGRIKQEAFTSFLGSAIEESNIVTMRKVILNKIPN